MPEKIQKPWAIYPLSMSIVKIVQDTKEGLYVQDSETQRYSSMFLSHKNLKRFDSHYDAIKYFCRHYCFHEAKIIHYFLDNFPSEKKNLQELLGQSPDSAQRRAKYTKELEQLEKTADLGYPSELDSV